MPRIYVGVSGVANPEQQRMIGDIAKEVGFDTTSSNLLLGVKATEKSQWHDRPNRYGELWYPVGENLRDAIDIDWDYDDIHRLDSHILPSIQLYIGELIRDPEATKEFVLKVLERSARWIKTTVGGEELPTRIKPAIQLDLYPWMYPGQIPFLTWLIEQERKIILQCHRQYMEEFHAYEIVRGLYPFTEMGANLSILFDASHGTGKEMDPESLRPFIGAVKESRLDDLINVGVAGGLSGDGVEGYVGPLLEEFGPLSWDAESKLHYQNGEENGDFKMDVLRDYLKASAELVRQFIADEPEGSID